MGGVLYLGTQQVTPIITIERKNKYGYNGHIDVAGLRELGWDDEDLAWLQEHCWWNEEDDEYWKVSEANKTKGKLVIWSNWRQTYYQDRDIRFFPKLTTPTITACFNNSTHLVAIPTHGWDLGSIKNWGNFATNAYSLRSVGDFADAIHEGITNVNIMFNNTYSLIDLGDISKWKIQYLPNKATSYFISGTGCIHLGDMSAWEFPEGFNYLRLFYNDYYLETIEGYPSLVADGTGTADINSSCNSLRHIKKSGKISRSVSFLYCYLLTRESILVLFNALDPDNAGTITLSAPSKSKLTDADKAIATNKGWTIA